MTKEALATPYKDLGCLAAVDPPYAITMYCEACRVKWTGCWDAFQCPKCGEGELPSLSKFEELTE